MYLNQLQVRHFRNFVNLELEMSPKFNLIYGMNGSGKTSLLEAICFLSIGRSFRGHLTGSVIHHSASRFILFGSISDHIISTIGLEKTSYGKSKIRIDQVDQPFSLANLAKLLPIQWIDSGSYALLSGGPKIRRQFLDWGAFHIYDNFFYTWKCFYRVLKQRNKALQKKDIDQVRSWNKEMAFLSQELIQCRENYLLKLVDLIKELCEQLLDLSKLSIHYYPGWNTEIDLNLVFDQTITQDLLLGYTTQGPHRSDLRIKINDIPVEKLLSRGEQKALIIALKLAQAQLLKQLTGKDCIYIFDDLISEIDNNYQLKIMHLLNKLEAQVFISAIKYNSLNELNVNQEAKIFYIESGRISEKYAEKRLMLT